MMTFVKRIALAAVFAGLTGVAANPTRAFMIGQGDSIAAGSGVDMVEAVGLLRDELKAGETTCDVMLVKIDEAIVRVDAALEEGVTDERKFIGLRDELVEMRLSLPCLADKLAQGEVILDSVPMADPIPMGDVAPVALGSVDGGCSDCGGAAGGYVGGGSASGSGGGSAGGIGGIGGSPLALAGLATAIALPLALDSDEPGPEASPSTAN